MNERIQELKQRAGIDRNPDQEGLDQFAELIVRECGNIAWKCGSEFIDNEIKKHFGVER